MAIALLVWLVLLYFCSDKPGWFGGLLVLLVIAVLIAGCACMRAPPVNSWRGSLRMAILDLSMSVDRDPEDSLSTPVGAPERSLCRFLSPRHVTGASASS